MIRRPVLERGWAKAHLAIGPHDGQGLLIPTEVLHCFTALALVLLGEPAVMVSIFLRPCDGPPDPRGVKPAA